MLRKHLTGGADHLKDLRVRGSSHLRGRVHLIPSKTRLTWDRYGFFVSPQKELRMIFNSKAVICIHEVMALDRGWGTAELAAAGTDKSHRLKSLKSAARVRCDLYRKGWVPARKPAGEVSVSRKRLYGCFRAASATLTGGHKDVSNLAWHLLVWEIPINRPPGRG